MWKYVGKLTGQAYPPPPVGLWKYVGKLTDQQKSLIEERLKYTDKELAKRGLKAGHRAGQGEAQVGQGGGRAGGARGGGGRRHR